MLREPKLRTSKGNYYLVFYDPNKEPTRKWIPMRTKVKRVAERRARPKTADYFRGRYDPWEKEKKENIYLGEAVDLFLKSKEQAVRKDTFDTLRYTLGPFLDAVGDKPLTDLSPEETHRFAFTGTNSKRTAQRRIQIIQQLLRWARSREYVDAHPVLKTEAPKPDKKPPRYLTRKEYGVLEFSVLRLIAEAKETRAPRGSYVWLLCCVRLAIATGLRRRNITSLTWDEVDMENGFLNIRRAKRGGYTVPIFPMARKVLEALSGPERSEHIITGPRGAPVDGGNLTRAYGRAAERAGLEDTSFHTLRHTFASWLVMEGVDLYQVSKWMGHSSIDVTEKYAHLSPKRQPKEADGVFE